MLGVLQFNNGIMMMNRNQEMLIALLKAMIKNEEEITLSYKGIEWQKVFEEAKAHQVHGMVYPILTKQKFKTLFPYDLWEEWKRSTLFIATTQISHIYQVSNLLEMMKEQGIEVIVLKGLVIREDYPRPELRTMCDADLLAKKEDLAKINDILIAKGYKQEEKSVVHTQYINSEQSVIEVHWTIQDERIFKTIDDVDKQLWEEAMPVRVGKVETLSLGLEDLLLHTCAHMATHLSVSGFGIRQVVDLAILLEKHSHQINWQAFCSKAEKWELKQFILTIFKVAHQLFDVALPKEVQALGKVEHKVERELINDILSSGVHGKRQKVKIISNELAKDTQNGKSSKQSSIIVNYLRYLFPSVNRLSNHYSYAIRHPWLLPIAWVHHLVRGLLGKKYSPWDKIKFLFTAVIYSYKRNKLLRKLGL